VRTLIIGVGQLGSRHAQSLATLVDLEELILVDPNPSSLELANGRVASTGYKGKVSTFTRLQHSVGQIELAVVSTSSIQRLSSLESVIEYSKPNHVLLEKLLTPSGTQLSELESIIANSDSKFWVNCPMPFFDHYRYIEEALSQTGDRRQLSYMVTGGNYGLVTNLIHYLDHFSKLSGSSLIDLRLRDGHQLIQSKRAGYSEIIGCFFGETEKGDKFSVEFDPNKNGESLIIEISHGDSIFRIDEIGLVLHDGELNGRQAQSPITTPRQSELTHKSMELILNGTSPMWANADKSIELHRWIFSALEGSLSRSNDLSFT
jgi:hypothetical protein